MSCACVVCGGSGLLSSIMLTGLAGVRSWYSRAPGVEASGPGGEAQVLRCPCSTV